MANNFKAEVVRYLRRKSSGALEEPTYIGAEQRFVSALRNSGINNLEEQYILGTDTYTEKYIDDEGNYIIETSFHINDADHNGGEFYKMKSKIYINATVKNEDYFFDGEQVYIKGGNDQAYFGNQPSSFPYSKEMYLINNDIFTISQDELHILPPGLTKTREDLLVWVRADGTEVNILLKKTHTRFEEDSVTGRQKQIIQESIENYIK